MTGQEETAFQAGGSSRGRGTEVEQGWFGWTGRRWGAPGALTLTGPSDCAGSDRFITRSVCVYGGHSVPGWAGEMKPPRVQRSQVRVRPPHTHVLLDVTGSTFQGLSGCPSSPLSRPEACCPWQPLSCFCSGTFVARRGDLVTPSQTLPGRAPATRIKDEV